MARYNVYRGQRGNTPTIGRGLAMTFLQVQRMLALLDAQADRASVETVRRLVPGQHAALGP